MFEIIVNEIAAPDGAADLQPRQTEVFRQKLAELDLRKFVIALNAPPRGRPVARPMSKVVGGGK